MALALFDLDNTLIAGDSDHAWGEFLVAQGVVDGAYYRDMNDQFYADYEAGNLDILAYLDFSLQPLTQLQPRALAELHQHFMEHVISPMWLPAAERLLQQHRDAGDRIVIITSTNRFIVEPICHKLGVEEILATELEKNGEHYTGKIVGTPTYKEGKVVRFNQWLSAQGISHQDSYFYSDSINDLPLMLEVARPIAVDPDPALEQEARQRGWKVISLRN